MLLPDVRNAEIAEEKIKAYLLNPHHPDGESKARFFLSLGFSSESWEAFAAAIRLLASRFEVIHTIESIHGLKYIVDGRIESPNGKSPFIRTVWIVDAGRETPRLVTAYPLDGGE